MRELQNTNVSLVNDGDVDFHWLATQCKAYGANLFILSDNTQEGTQFTRGFGGFGALLRWKINTLEVEEEEEEEDTKVQDNIERNLKGEEKSQDRNIHNEGLSLW